MQSSLTLLEVLVCQKPSCFTVMSKGCLLVLLEIYGSQTSEWQFLQWDIFLSLINKMTLLPAEIPSWGIWVCYHSFSKRRTGCHSQIFLGPCSLCCKSQPWQVPLSQVLYEQNSFKCLLRVCSSKQKI